ncbi:hypothetical protein EJ05DRAFT_9374 [Pseudovirgaria hyperparasitica]|uniref:Uncharacterized protein n=1 Tax=Pseudovirgaria hyperparasitica TaxID=470096 RepID=A0A6A6WKJ2_9PEZI|nr:uncharacterized protein EJ05DRAFT_9374 [Pseudovirgaria hyperparasitica]KAF2762687.1 hypothetical protein EJ05DRAFT_9374 [Pseudovirgaria hyperparasitica]
MDTALPYRERAPSPSLLAPCRLKAGNQGTWALRLLTEPLPTSDCREFNAGLVELRHPGPTVFAGGPKSKEKASEKQETMVTGLLAVNTHTHADTDAPCLKYEDGQSQHQLLQQVRASNWLLPSLRLYTLHLFHLNPPLNSTPLPVSTKYLYCPSPLP